MERRVFTLIWSFSGPDGCESRPGVELLAQCLSTVKHRVHVRTVRNAMKRLQELGYIVKTAEPIRRLEIATTWRVQVPDVLAPVEEFLARQALRGKGNGLARQASRGKADGLARNSASFSAQNAHGLARARCAPSSREGKSDARAPDPHCTLCDGTGWVDVSDNSVADCPCKGVPS